MRHLQLDGEITDMAFAKLRFGGHDLAIDLNGRVAGHVEIRVNGTRVSIEIRKNIRFNDVNLIIIIINDYLQNFLVWHIRNQ